MMMRHIRLMLLTVSIMGAACGKSTRDAGGNAPHDSSGPSQSTSSPQRASDEESSLEPDGKSRSAFADPDDGREEEDVIRQAAVGRRPSPNGKIFRGACSDCFDKAGATVVEACSKEKQCGACLAGANCAAAPADVISRWRAACVTLRTRCNASCFLDGAPTPTCPAMRLRSE